MSSPVPGGSTAVSSKGRFSTGPSRALKRSAPGFDRNIAHLTRSVTPSRDTLGEPTASGTGLKVT